MRATWSAAVTIHRLAAPWPYIFYVMPTSRGLQGGHVLLDAVEAEAQRRGIDPCRMGFKEQFAKHMQGLLADRGYEPFERTWVKWLRTDTTTLNDEVP